MVIAVVELHKMVMVVISVVRAIAMTMVAVLDVVQILHLTISLLGTRSFSFALSDLWILMCLAYTSEID